MPVTVQPLARSCAATRPASPVCAVSLRTTAGAWTTGGGAAVLGGGVGVGVGAGLVTDGVGVGVGVCTRGDDAVAVGTDTWVLPCAAGTPVPLSRNQPDSPTTSATTASAPMIAGMT